MKRALIMESKAILASREDDPLLTHCDLKVTPPDASAISGLETPSAS